jgi:hypothetical protein
LLHNKILVELKAYIDFHLTHDVVDFCLEAQHTSYDEEDRLPGELENFINENRKPTLSQILFRYIDEKGVSDTVIYKKAGLDRRHFSKIRSNPEYHPKKQTTLALALALELCVDEAEDLLNAAGYSLSDSDKSDLVIRFCLEREIYDLHMVNEALGYVQLKPLNT